VRRVEVDLGLGVADEPPVAPAQFDVSSHRVQDRGMAIFDRGDPSDPRLASNLCAALEAAEPKLQPPVPRGSDTEPMGA
jgi:hypothetical protein